MKNIFAASLLFIIVQLQAQSPKSSEFHGRVKSVEEHSFKAKDVKGEIQKGKPGREYSTDLDFIMEYDSSGRPSKRTWISMKGKVTKKIYYTYDAAGLLVNEKTVDANEKPIVAFSYSREFNSSGKLTRMMVTVSGVSTATTFRYTYDAKNNQYEVRETGEGSPMKTIDTRTFNSQSQIIRQWIYTPKNEIWGHEDYTYDDRGNCIEKTTYNSGNAIIIIYRWKYDALNNLVRYEVCGTTGQNCEAWTYKDEVDAQGNWTRRVEYRNGKPVFVKTRSITYY